jgi:hypothetical protein
MGKSSINKWAIFHGKLLNNQMVYGETNSRNLVMQCNACIRQVDDSW